MDCDGWAVLNIDVVFKDYDGHPLAGGVLSSLIRRSDSIIRHFVLVLPLDARLLESVIIAMLVSHYRTQRGRLPV